MKIEDIQKAQKLITTLADGISTQQEVLDGLRNALNDYVAFLQEEIEKLR